MTNQLIPAILDRKGQETEELTRLASYAVKSSQSRGRLHQEAEHPLRTAFQRDRDRIIHSSAFRRLEYKTQVFIFHEGDHYRNRLTHSLEGTQIARTIARALRLNEDLAETIILAHDLGHTPFGHSGERALASLMKEYGGFEHNTHSLRIVDVLEQRYPDFDGLNLTWETREGLMKHSTQYDHPNDPPGLVKYPSLEAQIADLADEIAYNNHDIDDGLRSGIITEEDLEEVTIWKNNFHKMQIHNNNKETSFKVQKQESIKNIINILVTDLIKQTDANLRNMGIISLEQVRKFSKKLVLFSEEITKQNTQLKKFLYNRLYQDYRVYRMGKKAERILEDLFTVYKKSPKMMPPHVYARQSREPMERVIADYIAGMTDKYALDEHAKLFDPHAKI